MYAFPLVKLPHSECITETIEYTRDDHKRERDDDDETNERVLFFFSLGLLPNTPLRCCVRRRQQNRKNHHRTTTTIKMSMMTTEQDAFEDAMKRFGIRSQIRLMTVGEKDEDEMRYGLFANGNVGWTEPGVLLEVPLDVCIVAPIGDDDDDDEVLLRRIKRRLISSKCSRKETRTYLRLRRSWCKRKRANDARWGWRCGCSGRYARKRKGMTCGESTVKIGYRKMRTSYLRCYWRERRKS